jgi:hypothetical protein
MTGTSPARSGDLRRAAIGQNVQTIFPGDRVVISCFFAAIGGVQFLLFLRGLFLHKKNWIRSSFYYFDQGMRRSR